MNDLHVSPNFGAQVVAGFFELPWVFISQLDTIRCETFVRTGTRATLYALPGYSPKALRDRAADGAVFLVRTGDMGLIRKDLARAIDRTLTDESLPPMVRSKTAYMIATAITVPALAGSAPDEDDLEVVRATVESLTRILLSAPEEMWRICAVMQDDVRTHTHAVNTAVLSMVMSKELGIESEEALREVGLGAFLHDLGLLRLPRRLLRRDMTGADEALYRLHPRKGVDMLRDRSGHAPVFARYILEHHERWDGTGYPQGLHGDQISVPGRLIAITAAFDVGTQVGPNDAAHSPFEALLEMKRDLGAYDPELLRHFIEVLGGRNLLRGRPAGPRSTGSAA